MESKELCVAGVGIRQDEEGRYSLNDLHAAAGGEQKNRPKYWIENLQTQALVAEIEKGGIPPIVAKQGLGTFVTRDLVYAYAMWISPSFQLKAKPLFRNDRRNSVYQAFPFPPFTWA